MKTKLLLLLLLATGALQAQSLTIETCYALAAENYPLVKQRELLTKSNEYTLQNLSKGYLPQLIIAGQATYQSEVTQVPISLPGMNIPTLSKDQYKFYGEVNQTLFDGGVIKQQKLTQQSNLEVEQQKLEVELYKIKERVNQLFFGILLVDEQIRQTELLKQDINLGLKKTEAAIANGTAFKSSADVLKAELLNADQRTTELKAGRIAYAEMLGMFINRQLDATVTLEKPKALVVSPEINRPEITLYESQNKTIDAQYKMLTARNLPKLNLFVQGGYGRPALNMLSNDFEAYYIGGVRLNWSLSGLYTLRKDKALLDLNRKTIAVQKETFLFNTNYTLRQQSAELNKYSELLTSDSDIIALRTRVKQTASVQLENGVITSNDYLREVNAEDKARQNKIVHEIQLLMAQYARQTTTGNSL
ncbi:MAG TPA: TolC family protein [Cyclobacteriaceae bacterium]|nr:TolC family protein [Cyclobacteriaceae bacterium]HMV08844.1 TolC family protein [Cyclobacteriaceae bacterium]HMV91205.1 TolC family protein [Cyclobacteriaceae bacterium]HMW99990.1 TolC family protein [Cyclobacteriaceae bacterium]HMX49147.1 TolC family protein [Cyclobacteriaceae bacterium]